jgi:hypothetical protein
VPADQRGAPQLEGARARGSKGLRLPVVPMPRDRAVDPWEAVPALLVTVVTLLGLAALVAEAFGGR